MDKNLLTKPATKEDLLTLKKDVIKLTKNEIDKLEKKLCNKLATKKELASINKKLASNDKGLASTNKRLDYTNKSLADTQKELAIFKYENQLEHKQLHSKIDEFYHGLKNEFLTGFDKIMVILNRMEQELTFTNHALRRHEDKLEDLPANAKACSNIQPY